MVAYFCKLEINGLNGFNSFILFLDKTKWNLSIKITITPEYEGEKWPYNFKKLYMIKC